MNPLASFYLPPAYSVTRIHPCAFHGFKELQHLDIGKSQKIRRGEEKKRRRERMGNREGGGREREVAGECEVVN